MTFPLFSNDVTHIVVDANNFFFRSLYGNDRLNTRRVVSHVYGAIRSLQSLVRKVDGFYKFHFVWDGIPRFRYDILKEYKISRRTGSAPKEEILEMKKRKDEFRDVLQRIPSTHYHHDLYEADDIIATLVTSWLPDSDSVWIISSDKDLWSLLKPAVKCFGNNSEVTTQEIAEQKYGVPCDKIALHKAFFGDTSDDIPGLFRVRKKVLTPILTQSNTVEEVLDFVSTEFTGSVAEREKIRDFAIQAAINIRVTKMVTDIADVDVQKYNGSTVSEFQEFLLSWDCPSLMTGIHSLLDGEI